MRVRFVWGVLCVGFLLLFFVAVFLGGLFVCLFSHWHVKGFSSKRIALK